MSTVLVLPHLNAAIPLPARLCGCGNCSLCNDRSARTAGRALAGDPVPSAAVAWRVGFDQGYRGEAVCRVPRGVSALAGVVHRGFSRGRAELELESYTPPCSSEDARYAAETAPAADTLRDWSEYRRLREPIHMAYEVGRGLGYAGRPTPDVARLEAEVAEAILLGWDRGDAEREIDEACAERYARRDWHEDEARRARSNGGHPST